MGNRYELESMLKSGKGFRIAALCFFVIAAFILAAFTNTEFIGGFIVAAVLAACGIIFVFCGVSISRNRKNTLDILEERDEIDSALEDYNAETTVRLDKKGRSVIGKEYIFALNAGRIYRYDEIFWLYISVDRQDGIPVSQVLNICTLDGRRTALISESANRKGTEKLNSYTALIHSRRPECLIGYSRDNLKAYKSAVSENKSSR